MHKYKSWGCSRANTPSRVLPDQRLAPAHRHQADVYDATTHCEVPLAQPESVAALEMKDNDPQQAHNHERLNNGAHHTGEESGNTVGPGVRTSDLEPRLKL